MDGRVVQRLQMNPWWMLSLGMNGRRSTATSWENMSSKNWSRITILRSTHAATCVIWNVQCRNWLKSLLGVQHSFIESFTELPQNVGDLGDHMLKWVVRLSVADQFSYQYWFGLSVCPGGCPKMDKVS